MEKKKTFYKVVRKNYDGRWVSARVVLWEKKVRKKYMRIYSTKEKTPDGMVFDSLKNAKSFCTFYGEGIFIVEVDEAIPIKYVMSCGAEILKWTLKNFKKRLSPFSIPAPEGTYYAKGIKLKKFIPKRNIYGRFIRVIPSMYLERGKK